MSNQKKENPEMVQEDPKLLAIKQLIFGENMVEYDQRFNDTMEYLEKVKKELQDAIAAVESQLDQTAKNLRKEAEDQNNALMNEIAKLEDKKADRKALGKMLQNIGEKLQA